MPIENYPKSLEEFKQLISGDKLVVVDFYATWCGPCKLIAPKFEQLVEKYPNVIFAKVDVDEVTAVAEEVQIRAMPTFGYFKNGQKIGEVVGASIVNVENKIKELA
ncbi:hypothetical protein VTP01DRAFT_8425 [Rhizomucor pusillus]|uniref:uncharacterized protein n=1 Tax=Rhizomucor pusillus TaxID=4840 RepID=UPI003742E671